MPKQIKVYALIVFIIALVFFAFFDRSKHDPNLRAVNSFGVDPYDAVGSFGVQLAIFIGGISMLRSLRPYPAGEAGSNQILLILRGLSLTLLSVAVPLAADIIALIRFRTLSGGSPSAMTLVDLVAGLTLLTSLAGWLISRVPRTTSAESGDERSGIRAILVCLASVLILAFYPGEWAQSIPGGIFTALVGMMIFIISVWSLSTRLFLKTNFEFEDLIDDLLSLYQGLKDRIRFASGLFLTFENLSRISWIRSILHGLNPRRHRWNIAFLMALLLGIGLATIEAFSEGASPDLHLFLIVSSVFIGIEGAGILLGYGLLSGYLGFFRGEKAYNRS